MPWCSTVSRRRWGISRRARKNKRAIIAKHRETFFGIGALPLRHFRPSDVARWLARQCANGSAAYYTDALSTIRQALDLAVDHRIIAESPAAKLKYRKRSKPIRQTPTFEQFQAIVASIRSQPFDRERNDSGDFVEFMGLSGLGQAEMASLVRSDVDLDAGASRSSGPKLQRNSSFRSSHNCARWSKVV